MDGVVLAFNPEVQKGNSLVEQFNHVADTIIEKFPLALLQERDLQVRQQRFQDVADNSVKISSIPDKNKRSFKEATTSILHHLADSLNSLEGIVDFDDETAVRKQLSGQKRAIVGMLIEAAISEEMLPDSFRQRPS